MDSRVELLLVGGLAVLVAATAGCAREHDDAGLAGLGDSLVHDAVSDTAAVGVIVGAAIGDPSVTILSPANNANFAYTPPGNAVTLKVAVDHAELSPGALTFAVYVDGEHQATGASEGDLQIFGLQPGVHHIAALLMNGDGVALPNPEALAAIRVKIIGPCVTTVDCDDANDCSIDACKGSSGTCAHGLVPGCCETDLACPNGWFCDDGSCRECADDSQCDDGNVCTADQCGGDGLCLHIPLLSCCLVDADCDDGLFCTQDECDGVACVNTPLDDPECCDFDSECVAEDPCLATFCYKSPSKGIQTCRTGPTLPGCCDADADCDDGNVCTLDACFVSPGEASGQCAFQADPELPECCLSKQDCDDGDLGTVDTCVDNTCVYGHDELYCELPIATALVINELQPHPGPRPDAVGEYIELYNPTDSLIELDGYELETSDGGFHSIVAPGLIMVPGSFIVLGPVIDPLLMGFTAHYAYGGDLELADPTSAGGPVE